MNTPNDVQVLARLQQARELVAHGWPSLAVALAGNPLSTAQARLAEAAGARYATATPKPWVQVLVDALALAEEAREAWGAAPANMPPMTEELAPCGKSLRLFLADAQRCAEMGLAWEDPGTLTRTQGLCALHLAVCLAEWRMFEQRAEAGEAQARDELARAREQRTQAAARAIWGGQPKVAPPSLASDSRSLRELAREMGVLREAEENDD